MKASEEIIRFILLNLIVGIIMTMMLAQPSELKVLLKQAGDGSYDTLVLGESHGETGIDPYLLSDELGGKAYNLCWRCTPVLELEYLLKQADQHHSLKTVILEIDPTYWDDGISGDEGLDVDPFLYLTGSVRAEYFIKELLPQNYNETFFDYSITKTRLQRIPETLKCKFSLAYLKSDESVIPVIHSITGTTEHYEYRGRGFRYGISRSDAQFGEYQFQPEKVRPENLKAFQSIVDYCRRNGIRLVCVQTALSPSRLRCDNFEKVHSYYADLCRKYEVPFYDLNYLKQGILKRTDADYVDLDGHPLGTLAEQQTSVIAQLMKSSSPDSYFCSSRQEVLDGLPAEGDK